MNVGSNRVLHTIPYTDFTRGEYEGRVELARALMIEQGIDALLVTSEHNFRYFVNDPSTTPIQSTRPRFLVIPAVGEPIALVPRGMDDFFQETTWVANYRAWPGPNPSDEGVSELANALKDLLPANAKIGTEFGPESRLGMPAGDFLRVMELVRPREFVDAAQPIFTPLRMIKSIGEIHRIRTICRVVSEAFDVLPMLIKAGMSEREVCRIFESECFSRGADKTAKIASVSGRGGYSRPYGVPSDKKLSVDDVIFIDAGCMFNFYWSDFNRNFSFGEPDPNTAHAYELVWEATQKGIEAVKPGVPVSSVWETMSQFINGTDGQGRATSIGRMGHSMGLWMPELPSVQPNDNTILAPGMILNIEPSTSYTSHFDGSSKLMLHEEVVVVTETGAELLTSRAAKTIPVVQ